MPEQLMIAGLTKKRFVYVLKRYGRNNRIFVGPNDAEVTDLSVAQQFGSRLAARDHTMNAVQLVASDWEYVKIELVPPPPKPDDASLADALIKDPIIAARMIGELHGKYCERLEEWIRHATGELRAFTAPKALVTTRPQQWAGLYERRTHTCHYTLPYAMLHLGDQPGTLIDFEHTIAHEVVHAYQGAFARRPMVDHGAGFYSLMRHAARYPINAHTHTYSLTACRRVSEAIQKTMEESAERGLLAGLSCEVVTDKINRKGVL